MSSNARARILEAAWELVRDRGTTGVTLAEVGRAAGVSRQAVYLHFEGRAGLLLAMARDRDERSGFIADMQAAAGLEGAAALERMIRLWCAYMPQIMPVARALEAALVTGDDAAVAWRDRMRDLRAAFRSAVRALEAEGRLAEGWSVKEATDWVYGRTHLTLFHEMVAERGWPAKAYADRLVASILAEILAPGKSDSGGRL